MKIDKIEALLKDAKRSLNKTNGMQTGSSVAAGKPGAGAGGGGVEGAIGDYVTGGGGGGDDEVDKGEAMPRHVGSVRNGANKIHIFASTDSNHRHLPGLHVDVPGASTMGSEPAGWHQSIHEAVAHAKKQGFPRIVAHEPTKSGGSYNQSKMMLDKGSNVQLEKLKNMLKKTKESLVKGSFGVAYIHSSDKSHKIVNVIDGGKAAHEIGGGNYYILKHPDTGKEIKVHQSNLKSIDFSKTEKKGYMSMSLDDLIAEHKDLVKVLRSGKKKELHKEMLEQKAELEDYIRRKKEVSKDDRMETLKQKHRLPKEPSNQELSDKMKAKYKTPKSSSFPDKVERVRAKNILALK